MRSSFGQATVEFALAVPIFLLLVLGVFELSRAVWQQNTLAFAVREGARYAIVHGSEAAEPAGIGSDQPVKDTVASNAIGVANVTVTVTWPDGTNDRGSRVTVSATAPFAPAAIVSMFTVTLHASSTLAIQR